MPAMDRETENRLIELETRNSYLERSVQELSEGVYAQQRRVDRLEAQLRSLGERLKDIAPANNLPAAERPPHY